MREQGRFDRGYTLIEMLVSMTIILTVTGAIFSMVNPSQGTSRVQPEYSDIQQRARVGADVLGRDLMMVGAGPYLGQQTGSLLNYFPPLVPYRTGQLNADPAGTFKDDTISLMYVPRTSAQTTIANDMPNTSTELKVDAQCNCPLKGPDRDPLCGFEVGMSVLIVDPDTGAFDSFEVTQSQSDAMHLQHRGQTLQESYPAHRALITEVEYHTYYWDSANLRLMHYDGLTTEIPILDNVVGITFTYFGDPNPPLAPKPTIGNENCLFDMGGNPKLPVLPATSGSLVPLDGTMLKDGPWCGTAANLFDADLFRIRQMQIRIRVQASDPSLRPTAAALSSSQALRSLFARPGTGARGSGGYVPDYEIRLDVTPRNMNLGR